MMRAPLDGGARGWVLRSLANLGVPPLVGVVLVLVPSRLLTLLAGFPSVLVGSRSFRKLSLKPVNLSGQSDDLRISTADSPPASVRDAVTIENTQIINDRVLVRRFTRDPCRLG